MAIDLRVSDEVAARLGKPTIESLQRRLTTHAPCVECGELLGQAPIAVVGQQLGSHALLMGVHESCRPSSWTHVDDIDDLTWPPIGHGAIATAVDPLPGAGWRERRRARRAGLPSSGAPTLLVFPYLGWVWVELVGPGETIDADLALYRDGFGMRVGGGTPPVLDDAEAWVEPDRRLVASVQGHRFGTHDPVDRWLVSLLRREGFVHLVIVTGVELGPSAEVDVGAIYDAFQHGQTATGTIPFGTPPAGDVDGQTDAAADTRLAAETAAVWPGSGRPARPGRSRSGSPRRRQADAGRLLQPAPPGAPSFAGTSVVGDYAVLRWQTPSGAIAVGYPLADGNGNVLWLLDKIAEYRADIFPVDTLAVPQMHWLVAPDLHAVDVDDGRRPSPLYKPSWEQLAAHVGMPVPWWHSTLRDSQAILEWSPGDPPAVVPAEHASLRTAALAALATDEPDGSPAADICFWLARQLRHDATDAAHRYIEDIHDHADRGCRGLHVAAVPAPIPRPEPDDDLPEVTRRAGWAQITERRDTLAHQVADLAQQWDGGGEWPMGEIVELDPERCDLAAQLVDRLAETDTAGTPPTVLERHLLSQGQSDQPSSLFHDPATGLPAVKRGAAIDQAPYIAASPQRIPTTAPLAAVTLSDNNVWIHTSDGQIWLAPQIPGHGLSWGYGGGGPWTLAVLLNSLLDDITAPAVDDTTGPPPDGLLDLVVQAPQDQVISLTRDDLETARRQT